MKKIFIALMLSAASASTWAQQVTLSSSGMYGYSGNGSQDVCTISGYGNKSLKELLSEAGITSSRKFDRVVIKLDNAKNKVEEGLAGINTYALDLADVSNLNSWANIKNQYVSNVILPSSVGLLNNSVKNNFNLGKLYNVITVKVCNNYGDIAIDAYVNKPGFLANGLQYISKLNPNYSSNETWWNVGTPHGNKGYDYTKDKFAEVRLSGYVFARDIMSAYAPKLTDEGHLTRFPQDATYQSGYSYCPGSRCTNPLAPSYSDKNVIYPLGKADAAGHGEYGNQVGAMLGSQVTSFDFTNAQFGELVTENGKKVFKYYPADMTITMLQDLGKDPQGGRGGSVVEIKLPTSPTQYIIPEGFLVNSKYIHEICIPCNYTEIHQCAFLNGVNGITRYTTTAAEDDELKGIKEGELIDYGPKTLTLPSTTKFIARAAFSGYGGAALLEDVYVLAKKAPICEFYAFDQKTCVGEDSHEQGHLIKKGNYVNPNNGMAMLHFPNTDDQREMLNYSDMTRKYRLYDETGKFDNIGNILVWPTQAQYNRSFNQAMAGVTWAAWKENLPDQENPTGKDDPERAFSGGVPYQTSWVAGWGDVVATHETLLTLSAKNNGFTQEFFEEMGFDGSYGKGNQFNMGTWDDAMIAHSKGLQESDRPLTYDWERYGGWHQFAIAELYDFMLDVPGPDPVRPDYFNFANYNKNIWYAVCFPFNLTKAQLQKALGDPAENKYPVLSTLAGVTRDADKLGITIHMSKDLVKNKVVYENENGVNTVKCDLAHGKYVTYTSANYGDDDIVLEANKPYFVLPALPEVEIKKAADAEALGKIYNRKSEITVVKQEEGQVQVMFPEATRIHAVNATSTKYVDGQDKAVSSTDYAFNYYFVGNYIPQPMPENAYFLTPTKKSDGSDWSSFCHYNSEKRPNVTWTSNSAIVIAVIDDNQSGHARSKGSLVREEENFEKNNNNNNNNNNNSNESKEDKVHNYIWKVEPYNDFIFFAETNNQTWAKSAFGMKVENNYTTSIELPVDMDEINSGKVYNLNGQFVGIDTNKMAKGIYIVGGKKVVVK